MAGLRAPAAGSSRGSTSTTRTRPTSRRSRSPRATAGSPYLGEIAYTDQVVGRWTSWLETQGLLERTSGGAADHGESLGDHGEATHAYFIYGATTHVPLIVRTPWGLTGRGPAQVSAVDIMPTVLDLVGLAPQEGLDGRSLARALLDPAPPRPSAYSETYFTRYHFGWQHLRGLRDDRYAYIDAREPELYDLPPGSRRDAQRLQGQQRARRTPAAAPGGAARSDRRPGPRARAARPGTLQRLAALGYVGNVVDVDPDAGAPRSQGQAAASSSP